ncbi:Lateral organ boundaries domain containing protein [Parasponia andersonii]|uniref:Lateral organ boundaries domain containing protein n=1 Tax=Parasponia andersonii TaxID=3476 RepID=A0A2P5BRH9_PARAD|nr:Lateral organ boundaries domain containing protein [Parasponia andersonii]
MGGNSPCASCKLLRRRCAKDCIFAPYFPSDDPHKFAIVHKVFGASNVSKMLQELPVHQRADAVSSLVYEANARMRDPVYGCVGAISYLQNQVSELQMQLAVAQAEILCIQMQQDPAAAMVAGTPPQILDPADYIGQYEKSCFLGHNNGLMSPPQYHNFASSATSIAIHDSLKRESILGNDMVS